MLSDELCLEVRDFLFSKKAINAVGEKHLFSVVAVTNDNITLPYCDAVVTFYVEDDSWRYTVEDDNYNAVISAMLSVEYEEFNFEIVFCDMEIERWPCPWDITAKSDMKNYPTLILRQFDDGMVRGALMRDTNTMLVNRTEIPNLYPTIDDAHCFICAMEDLDHQSSFNGMVKERNTLAPSLATAMSDAPKTQDGCQAIFIYDCQAHHWKYGVAKHSPLQATTLTLTPLIALDTDDHFAGIAPALPRYSLEPLRDAIRVLRCSSTQDYHTYESHPAIKSICDSWNKKHGNTQPAAAFRLYVWDTLIEMFTPFDSDEPDVSMEAMEDYGCVSFFHEPGGVMYAVIYLRGREFNVQNIDGETHKTIIFLANGRPFMVKHEPEILVDESFYSMLALRVLSRTDFRQLAQRI